ncbi:MAG: polymer-forming cytoskeletal protein [Anaerolineae bacterium]|nr:polymer-forming cytoskeletal protein [Anaerolineae bacterium]
MRRLWIGAILIILVLLARDPSAAREIRQGDQCEIAANEVIQGNLFILCRTLKINGTVDGDVIGAATEAQVNGTVLGDVYLAAGQLEVAGTVGSNLHFVGSVLRILESAQLTNEQADLMSLSLSTFLEEGARIPGNISAGGYQLILNGDVDGEISFWGSALQIRNQVGGDVDAVVGDPQSTGVSQLQTLIVPFGWVVELVNPGLMVDTGGQIEGHLQYSAPTAGVIEGEVNGGTIFTQLVTQPDLGQIITNEDPSGLRILLAQALREFAVLATVGLIGLTFLPRQFQAPLRSLQNRPLPSMGMGLLAFIISFPVMIVMLILIIFLVVVPLLLLQTDGLFIGLVSGTLIGVWGGTTSIFYFTAIFISRAIISLLIGRVIVRTAIGDDGSQRIAFISFMVGVVLMAVLNSLPVFGILVSALAAFLGLGAILTLINTQFRSYRDQVNAPLNRMIPMRVPARRDAALRHPPLLEDRPSAPGMDNLPEGFEWWDD